MIRAIKTKADSYRSPTEKCVIDSDIPAVLEAPGADRLSLFVYKDYTSSKATTYNGQEYLYQGGYRCGTTLGIDGGSRKMCNAQWLDGWTTKDMCTEFNDISDDWELTFYHTGESP